MELTTRRNVDKKHGLFEELCRRVGLYVENDTCFRMFLGKISLYHWEKQCFMVNMKCRDQNRLQLACVGISCLSLEEEIHSWKFWMQINAFILCYGWIWSPLGYLYYLITRCEEEDRIPASPTAYRAFKLHNPGKSKSLVKKLNLFKISLFQLATVLKLGDGWSYHWIFPYPCWCPCLILWSSSNV